MSPDRVVARWEPDDDRPDSAVERHWKEQPREMISQVREMLDRAALPGYAHLYEQAQRHLSVPVRNNSERIDVWLLWADVQQHHHRFDSALSALDRVFESDPVHVQGRLMAARIHLVKGAYKEARNHCIRLVGNADLLTASVCAHEAASYQGAILDNYQGLLALLERESLPGDARGPWIRQTMADMATRLGRPQEAIDWLDGGMSDAASVSYLLQWADAQLVLSHPEKVMERIEPVVTSAPAIDDSLALRLALAEQSLVGEEWQAYVKARMALRVQRRDVEHASDVARYYLQLDPDPEKALHWAKLNWQSAREHSDRKLLLKARKMAAKTSKSGEEQ
ncbi:hypothetical protein [Marinimicrobium locisalis]|uniref:hypothetical protein n=1 Tax=Marinimicrobium locisalis TaxID=546022 RepID=UPI003221B715